MENNQLNSPEVFVRTGQDKDNDFLSDNSLFLRELDRQMIELENQKKSIKKRIKKRHLIFDLVYLVGIVLLILLTLL